MELIERDHHLAALAAHLAEAAAGHGRVVLVGGEAGVGKSVLVEAFCREIAGPAAVLRASCDALSTPGPLGPIRDLAPSLGIRIDQSGVEGDHRDRLFRDVLAALAARRSPTIVVGEDAHWADGASLELLRFLARRIGELPVLVLLTYRDDELGPAHPLRLALGDLATSPTVHRLRVSPLSEAAVRDLARDSGRDSAELHRLTGGNPFFLSEVLVAAADGVPATVGDAVLARAARLAPEARAVLDVAAVIGAGVEPDLITTVAGPVLDEIDECIDRGLLRAAGDEIVFRHELAREAILAAIAPPRRRLLHARVLATLRECSGRRSDPALLAHHAEAAGDRVAVLEFAIAAAGQAASLHAHHEAAAQYARALRFADGLPDAERAVLLDQRATACYLSGQGDDAIAAHLAALEIWRRRNDRQKEAENLEALSRAYRWAGRLEEAEATGRAALAALETLPAGPRLAAVLSNLTAVLFLTGRPDVAQDSADRAVALAERFGEPATLVDVLVNVGSARLYAGDDRGEGDLERGLENARTAGLVESAGRALVHLAGVALSFMRLEEADHRHTTAIDYAAENNLDHYRWYLQAKLATINTHRGQWDEAIDQASEVLLQPGLSPWPRIAAMTVLGRLQARRGEPGATASLDGALALAEQTGAIYLLAPILAARAEAALLAGDRDRALTEARRFREIAFRRGNPWQKGECIRLLWRAGAAVPPMTDPPRSSRRARHRQSERIIAEPFAWEIAGEWTRAALAWREIGCPYEAASVLAESDDPDAVRSAIETFERLGARPAAAAAVRRLRDLGVRDLPPLRRGPRASTRANPAGLTRREAEVLALLVDGCRNGEIADRLYLTPKTVGHHVSAIFAKLGVGSRAEAAHAAARLGIGAA